MANIISIGSLFLLICHLWLPSIAASTVPAFIWSNHRSVGLHAQEAVDYHVLTPEALVDTLMQKLGWSSLLCNSDSGESEKLDAVVAFIGNELYSEDVARDARVDSSPVLRILKEHFMSSRYSLAFPYVSVGSGGGLLNVLVSSIKDSCNLKSRPGKTLIVGSCVQETFDPKSPLLTEGIELVDTVEDLKDFISRRKASRKFSETDIILTCPSSKHGLEEGEESEEDLLVSVLSALRQSGTSNTIFYASDPLGELSGHRYNGRMLASNATATNTTTCDDVCETIAGVYEGIIVAITLLIILISGLCCMMGIDTPSRFESSQE